MQAKAGDRIIVESEKMNVPPRVGEVLEVIEHDPRTEFRVRWDDDHESSIRPAAGSFRIEPAARPTRT
ncbi:MAG: DUF1918 domain-containing protein [Chloroflexota bacterium]